MKQVNWGIIGCGDVAEVKSGPAFNLVANSALVAVMRRDASKAKDFAKRHQVPFWYDSADALLTNEQINAVYIATPPSSHLSYTLKALKAGKHVYLEKPMTLNAKEASYICDVLNHRKNKLTVAHYRRKLSAFLKVQELIEARAIGKILKAEIKILQPSTNDIIAKTVSNWRLDPDISGGGYFHDIAPHQLDLMTLYFGAIEKIETTKSSSKDSSLVTGEILFKNGVEFNGVWNFNAKKNEQKDECCITGTDGTIIFSFYGTSLTVHKNGQKEHFKFENPKHIQQPMIASVTNYFLGVSENPCTAEEGLTVMEIMDIFTK